MSINDKGLRVRTIEQAYGGVLFLFSMFPGGRKRLHLITVTLTTKVFLSLNLYRCAKIYYYVETKLYKRACTTLIKKKLSYTTDDEKN